MAKRKTRTVTRYVSKSRRRSSNGGGGTGLSVAIVAGMLPGVMWTLEPATSGNWPHAMERGLAAYTGYYIPEKRFRLDLLARGLFPLAMGMLFHSLANRFGINRAIKKIVPLPISI